MKLYFDVSCLSYEQITGIGNYTKQLFLHLNEISSGQLNPISSISRLKRRKIIESHISQPIPLNLLNRYFYSDQTILHTPDHRQPIMRADVYVQTIHDVAMLEDYEFSNPNFKKTFAHRFNQLFQSEKIDHFVTVSHFTKNRVLAFFPHLENKISVIHAGTTLPSTNPGNSERYPWPYILCVGTIEKRKNTKTLVEAFEAIASRNHELRLVLIGKEGYGSEDTLKAIDANPFKDRIIWRQFVSADELKTAYRYAEVFTMPSVYEGFGLPVLEALAFGCSVVCSDIEPFIEIGGDAIKTVSPYDAEAMASTIEEVYLNQETRADLKKRALIQAAGLSWSQCAQKTWNLYSELI
ncbi:MAG: hypothetical protein RJB66_2280 [Pseudomonadota bacterium]|jgi:glycosyltransferase involved in cell wall biosynthesis